MVHEQGQFFKGEKMSFKERIKRLENEERVKIAEERRSQDLEKERAERKVEEEKERLSKALESRKIPEIMAELNKECLEGRGSLSFVYPSYVHPYTHGKISLTLDWDKDEYICVEGKIIKKDFGFSKVELTLRGNDITNYGRNSLEEAIAEAFLHPGSHKADNESFRRSMSP